MELALSQTNLKNILGFEKIFILSVCLKICQML